MNKLIFKFACFLWMFERGLFYRDLADAFRRKATTGDFLDRELANARMVKAQLKILVMQHLVARFATGNAQTVSELMRKATPASDQMLLRAVDDASNKSSALESAADAIDFQVRSLKILAVNLVVPIVALPAVGFICWVSADVIILIAQSAPPAVWNGFNGGVRFTSEFISSYWLVISLSIAAVIAAFILSLPRWKGKSRLKFDDLPGFSLYRDYNAAVVLSALAMMMSPKKPLVESLESIKGSGGSWLRWHLQRVLFSLEDNPNNYGAAFSRGLMPMNVRSRLATLMDSSKSFDEALITLGSAEVSRLENSVKLSAMSLNFILVGSLTCLAVYLSVGQMTIVTALNNESSMTKIMQRK